MHPTCVLSRHQRGCFFRRGTKELIYCRFKSLVWLNLLLSNYTYIYTHILIQMINTIYANNIYIWVIYTHCLYIYNDTSCIICIWYMCTLFILSATSQWAGRESYPSIERAPAAPRRMVLWSRPTATGRGTTRPVKGFGFHQMMGVSESFANLYWWMGPLFDSVKRCLN